MTATASPRWLDELASAYLDAWHRHDIDKILALHTSDTVYTSVATGREAIGLDAVRELLTTVFAVWPDLHFFERRLYLTPELVVFESTAEVTQAVPLPLGDTMVEPTGATVRFDVADVLAIRDGKIARKDSYVDALGYLRAMRATGAVTYPVRADSAAEANAPTLGQPMPAAAMEMVAYVGLAYVATTKPDGRPNVSPKGTLKVLRTLAFAEIASPQTLENIRHLPYLEVNVMDPFRRLGWRFRGRADIVDDPDLIRLLGEGLGADYPIRHAVRINVEETRKLTSPIYWVTDLDVDDVIAIWEAKLGYQRRERAGGPTVRNAAANSIS